MPNKKHKKDPRIQAVQVALQRRMASSGDMQNEVAIKVGVSQSDVSRVLNGQRKRFTKVIARLCQYAELDMLESPVLGAAEDQLSQSVRRAIGDNPAAAIALSHIIESLTPLLRAYQLPDLAETPGAHP
jgi:transcriptional regulator with XRE-family HTH domain